MARPGQSLLVTYKECLVVKTTLELEEHFYVPSLDELGILMFSMNKTF